MTIALISVYTDDPHTKTYNYNFLYALLAQREEYQNISHKSLPQYQEHVSFVNSKPYKDWFIIYNIDTKQRVGSIYLSKENEVGIFISKNHKKKGYGRQALNSLMEYFKHVKEIKANIAPFNSTSICFFVNMGFKYRDTMYDAVNKDGVMVTGDIIQYTYKIINPYYVEHAQQEVEV